VLLTWLPGRQLDRGLTPARLTRVGRLIGRLHGVAARMVGAGRIQTQRAAMSLDLREWAAGNRRGSERLPDAHRQLLQAVAARASPRWTWRPRCSI
jgi:Ser/Thr protein kinase RdoA (MazF antagonist)